MKAIMTALLMVLLLPAMAPAQTTTVTVPLGSVTLPPPPPQAITPVTITVTITVNGAPMQASCTLAGSVGPVAGSSTKYQLMLTPPSAPLALTPAGTTAELPPPPVSADDSQPWLFISGFADMAGHGEPPQITAGSRFMIQGHDFGEQTSGCRVEVNNQLAGIQSWLDDLIVVQAPVYPDPSHPASVLVWRGPQSYDLTLAPFMVTAPAS